ncbi:hypothetical protein MTP99_014628 [Tenebrio molitor]|nr:hypothetical protein MTP99_014628 [Tenebrio molitor]
MRRLPVINGVFMIASSRFGEPCYDKPVKMLFTMPFVCIAATLHTGPSSFVTGVRIGDCLVVESRDHQSRDASFMSSGTLVRNHCLSAAICSE